MIIGIGSDLIEVNRVLKSCEKIAFINKCFTLNEQHLFEKRRTSAAGNFAVKEAVAKMLGTGFRGFGPIDIEVLRNEDGKPYVLLHNKAAERGKELGIVNIHVTISDTKDLVTAFVIGEGI